jgi:hypothetical protein
VPTIRIATVIESVDSDKYILGANDFRPGQSKGEENCVTSRDVSYRDNAITQNVLRNLYIVSESRASDRPKIEADEAMLDRREVFGNTLGSVQLA